MRIFIGSSGKKKRIAENIAKALESADFEVFRWWKTFRGGDITIERLMQMSDVCDGAVFIFGADDKILTETKDGEKELVATRDNVLLEYGMFAGKTGPKKTLFVREENVNIPSDLLGITSVGEPDYVQKIVRGLQEAFGNVPPSQIASRIVIHASRMLLHKVEKETPVPLGWSSRSLYIGSRGAKAWAAVEEDVEYSGHQEFLRVRGLIEQLARKTKLPAFGCIISFGPGLGLLDSEVVPILRGQGMAEYIAVDINDYLAVHAADKLDRASSKTQAPFCILADFENDMSLIADIINERTKPGRVFMMLGGTFGNLEKGEDEFLDGLHGCMRKDDLAILDVFSWCKGYTVNDDNYRKLDELSCSIKLFLAGGVARRNGRSVEDIMESINDYVTFSIDKPTSQIEGTKEFMYCCKQGNYPLIYVRRYNSKEFKKHLTKRHFKVIESGTVGDKKKLVHRSVYFFKKV